MNQIVDPNDYIITRKRKKYRFAKFANAKNCFEYTEWLESRTELGSVDVVEIGAGTGLFSLELAKRYPSKKFVALDVKADRLQKGAYEALEQGIENVYFLRARADQVDELFAAKQLDAIWITFPDPFPKSRSTKRRLTHAVFLDKYHLLLKQNTVKAGEDSLGGLYLKHDNTEFFTWSLEQMVSQGWLIKQLSFDLHDSSLPDVYKTMTTYEKRWLGEGRKTQLVRATR